MKYSTLAEKMIKRNSNFSRKSQIKFVNFFLFIVGCFLLYHAIIWNFYTSKLLSFDDGKHIGDLARIGYQIDSMQPRQNINTLPRRHIEFSQWKGEPIDILTIGDSFSNGGAGGQNSYYQDYIANYYNCNVLNIPSLLFGENAIETLNALLNTRLLDTIHPKIVLIESVERSAIQRYAKPLNWNPKISSAQLYNTLKKGKWGDLNPKMQQLNFITTANYKYPIYNLLYNYSENAFNNSNIYKVSLTTSLFSCKANKTLLFYKDDIKYFDSINEKNILQMNQNFNHLSDLLTSKKIQLFVMIAADKYDLYSEYIQNNKYPKNRFFDIVRPLTKRYIFIDTKSILLNSLKTERDIYFADDTHWSNKASIKIFQDKFIQFNIKQNLSANKMTCQPNANR